MPDRQGPSSSMSIAGCFAGRAQAQDFNSIRLSWHHPHRRVRKSARHSCPPPVSTLPFLPASRCVRVPHALSSMFDQRGCCLKVLSCSFPTGARDRSFDHRANGPSVDNLVSRWTGRTGARVPLLPVAF